MINNDATKKAATFWDFFINDKTQKRYNRVTNGNLSGGIYSIGIMADDGSMGSIRWEKNIGWHGVGGDKDWRDTTFKPMR
jgi:hypothetical protein